MKLVTTLALVGGVLAACGGAHDAEQTPSPVTGRTSDTDAPMRAAQQEGAALNTRELAALANRGDTKQVQESLGWIGGYAPVYRAYNVRTRGYFLTSSRTELDRLVQALPHVRTEGTAFFVLPGPDARPVHRFYDARRGVHFYTISEAEQAHVAARLPRFTYEGVAFTALAVPKPGHVPLYRFFSVRDGVHFYTADPKEAATVRLLAPSFVDEGIAFYVEPAPNILTIQGAGLRWLDEVRDAPMAPAEVLDPEAFRGSGSAFGAVLDAPLRQHLLIQDAAAWQVFLERTAQDMRFLDPVPVVDFAAHQILALNLAMRSGCSGDRVVQTLRSGAVVQVVVESFLAPPDVLCTAIYQPVQRFLVLPRVETVQVTRPWP